METISSFELDRNLTEEFARRTRKNLQFIEDAAVDQDADVHRVVQITLSLLGIVIFPWERAAFDGAKSKTLADMRKEKWPTWDICLDAGKHRTENLGQLLYHLRNGVSHGRVTFSSSDPDPSKVVITVEDAKPKTAASYWAAQIRADDLRDFCERCLAFIEERAG